MKVLILAACLGQLSFASADSQLEPPSLNAIHSETTRSNSWPAPPTASPVVVPTRVYVLKQIVYQDQYYFVDAYSAGLTFAREDETSADSSGPAASQIRTNVVVYAVSADGDRDEYVSAMPEIRSWVDPRGFFHTVDVLKEQLRYNRLLIRELGPCGESMCVLTNGRDQKLFVMPAWVNGIMDATTFSIPYYRLEIAYDRLYSQFERRCASIEGGRCRGAPWPDPFLAYWSSELARFRYLLDGESASDNALIRQFTAPTRLPTLPDSCRSPACGPEGGLYVGEGPYQMLRPYGAASILASAPSHTFVPSGTEPESLPSDSFDPAGSSIWSDGQVMKSVRSQQENLLEYMMKIERQAQQVYGVGPIDRSGGNP